MSILKMVYALMAYAHVDPSLTKGWAYVCKLNLYSRDQNFRTHIAEHNCLFSEFFWLSLECLNFASSNNNWNVVIGVRMEFAEN